MTSKDFVNLEDLIRNALSRIVESACVKRLREVLHVLLNPDELLLKANEKRIECMLRSMWSAIDSYLNASKRSRILIVWNDRLASFKWELRDWTGKDNFIKDIALLLHEIVMITNHQGQMERPKTVDVDRWTLILTGLLCDLFIVASIVIQMKPALETVAVIGIRQNEVTAQDGFVNIDNQLLSDYFVTYQLNDIAKLIGSIEASKPRLSSQMMNKLRIVKEVSLDAWRHMCGGYFDHKEIFGEAVWINGYCSNRRFFFTALAPNKTMKWPSRDEIAKCLQLIY